MAAARRRRLSRAVAAVTLASLVLLPGVAATAEPVPPTAEPADSLLTITSITPVVEDGQTATVRGRLTNTGTQTLTEPEVSLVPQEAPRSRADVASWADAEEPVTGSASDAATLDDLPAGASAPFVLEVDASDLIPGQSAGAARVSVQTDDTAVHTFVGVHRTKEYEPLSVVWGVPLTLPADVALDAAPGTARARAWQEAVGPDSRLAALTADPPEADEAWILDPTLLSVPADPGDSETRTAEQERTVRAERAAAIRDRLEPSRTLVLPDADADVAAGTGSAAAGRLIRPRLLEGIRTARELGARSDVLWPADGVATSKRAEEMQRLRTGGAPTLLVPDSSLEPGGFTPTGGTRTAAGTPLVVNDGPLSRVVTDLDSPDDVVLARQRLVAESATLLRERPGTPRSVVIVPDRDATPSAEAWEQLRTSVDDIPWLAKGDLRSVLAAAADASPGPTARSASEIEAATKADPARAPVLSRTRAQRIRQAQAAVGTFASVRSDGPVWEERVRASLEQLTSARWRNHRAEYARLLDELRAEATLESGDLQVRSGDVNFFADTGRLQITVVNTTDVELTNLVVALTPDTPSLRIDAPADPVTIGPGGVQTVTVQATALAAGQVPVRVTVATPSGKQLAEPATLHAKVRPTGDWIYWLVGGIAALLLAAGTWRTVRGGRRATAADRPSRPEGT